MKHFQSKVLTAAILAALSGSAIAADVYEKSEVYTKSEVGNEITKAKTEVTTDLESKITAAKTELETKLADQNKSGKEDFKKIKKAMKDIVTTLMEGGVDENGEKVPGLNNAVSDLNTSVESNKSKIEELTTDLADTNAALAETDAALDATTNALNEATDQFNTFATSTVENIKAIDKKLEDVSNAVSDHADKFNDIADSLDEALTTANEAKQLAEETKQNVDTKVEAAENAASKAKADADRADTAVVKAEAAAAKVTDIEEAAEVALVAAHKNTQDINGFQKGDIIYKSKDGKITEKVATDEDVKADGFGGLGLKKVVAQHDQSLADLTAETERARQAAEQAAFAAIENAQELNGFKEGDEIVVTDADGAKSTREATEEDVKADSFGGSGLKKVVEDHDKELEDLTETVNKNTTDIATKADKTELEKVSDKVTANETAIGKKADQTALDEVSKKVTANETAIGKKADKTALDAVSDKVTANETAIGKKANSADVYTKAEVYTKEQSNERFVKIDTSINGLNTTANGLETRLAAAEKSVKDHGTRLDSAEKSITEHGTRLNGLDKAVSDLRKETRQGLAEQAALSGLFQPYNVGRFNVTAAVGGYKSESAVAIGTGFRFTENFAAKAGVAVGTSSGSSAAYHVGVNYEW